MPDSETDVSELAREVVDELDPGSTIGDKVILSRRQLLAVAGGGLSAGALATLGAGNAQAQAAGTIGTTSNRVDIYANNIDASSFTVDETLDAVQDSDLDLGGNNLNNVGALEAETLAIGGQTREPIETISIPQSSTSQTFSFDNLSNEQYFLSYRYQPTESGDCWLRVNNVDNEQWGYFDESGTSTYPTTEMFLFSNSGAAQVAGGVKITQISGGRIGVNHSFQAADVSDISGFAETGGYNQRAGDISSIQFSVPSAEDKTPSEVRLWRLDP